MWRTQETQIPNGHRRLTLDFRSPAARAKKVPFLNEPPTSGLLWVTANKDRCLQNFLWALSIQYAGKSFLAYSDHLILTPLMEQRNYIVIHIRQSITLIWASQYINSTITCGSQSTVPIRTKRLPAPLTDTPPHACIWSLGARGTWGALSAKADADKTAYTKGRKMVP